MATLVTNILDNELIRTLLYSATAGVGITAAVFLFKSPEATPAQKRVAYASIAFECLLGLWALIQLFRFVSNRAYGAGMPYSGM